MAGIFSGRTYLNQTHLREMMVLMRESRQVKDACTVIANSVLQQGIGIVEADEGDHPMSVPLIVENWVKKRFTMFSHEVIAHLACLGFVIYTVCEDTMDARVIDPRTVRIAMELRPGRSVEYVITSLDGRETSYGIYVVREPDMIDGVTTAALSTIHHDYSEMLLYRRNAVVRDTINSETVFLLESRGDGDVSNVLSGRSDIDRDGMGVAGYSVGVFEQLDTRASIREEMFLTSQRFARNITHRDTEPRLRGLRTNLNVMDTNPSRFDTYNLEPGIVARQRNSLPGVSEMVSVCIYYERQIYQALGVPFSLVAEHTGAHTNTMAMEDALLQATCKPYMAALNDMLRNVSCCLVGTLTMSALARKLDAPQKGTPRQHDESSVVLHTNSITTYVGNPSFECVQSAALGDSADGKFCIRVKSMAPTRLMSLLYENGLMKHDVYTQYLSALYGHGVNEFMEEDVRPATRELRAVAEAIALAAVMPSDIAAKKTSVGAHGPGHNGESTLSTPASSEQQQTRDPTATLKRKRAL